MSYTVLGGSGRFFGKNRILFGKNQAEVLAKNKLIFSKNQANFMAKIKNIYIE